MLKFIFSNLPALIITAPLFMAAIIAILPRSENGRWFAWFLSFSVSGFVFAGCFYLLIKVILGGSESYSMGGWSPPFGIQYLATELNIFILFVLAGANLLLIPSAYVSAENEINKSKIPLFYSCYLLCLAGLLGMVITNDIFNIYVFLEISSLSAYALIAMGKNPKAAAAAFNYLVIGTTGASFFLLGVALIYAQTGTLNMSDIATTLKSSGINKVTAAAFVFMTIGLLVKSAVFPFHSWLPRCYQYAPSFVSAFLSSLATKVALFVLIRVIYEVFGLTYLSSFLIFLALLGMLYGSLSACLQSNVSRLLAFSSIANVSYILLGISSFESNGITAGLYHYLAHSLSVGGLFVVAGIVSMHTGGTDIKNFAGIGKKFPLVAGCFVILGLSLVGIPLTPGFVSKWYFINSALNYQNVILQISIITSLAVSSLLSAWYVWKIIEVAYFHEIYEEYEIKYFSSFSIVMLTIMTIFFGLNSSFIIKFLNGIASTMLSGGGNV